MKKHILLLFACFLHVQADPVVTRVGDEWFASGDFDGDGHTDVLALHGPSASYQVFYNDPEGQELSPLRYTGTADISEVFPGRIGNVTADRLVIASPTLNHLPVFDDSQRDSGTVVSSRPLEGIGPNFVLVLPNISPSASPEADLLVQTRLNNIGPMLERRDGNATHQLLSVVQPGDLLRDPARFRIKATQPAQAAAIRVNSTGDEFFQVIDADALTFTVLTDEPLAGQGNRFVTAILHPLTTARVLTWREQDSFLQIHNVHSLDYHFETTHSFDLGAGIDAVVVLGANPNRLLVRFDGGLSARLYDFDGVDQLTLLETFSAPPGGALTGAAALGGGRFALLSSTTPGGRSEQLAVYNHDSAPYTQQAAYPLQAGGSSGGSNVFVFDGEPFVDAYPRRLYSTLLPDWTQSAYDAAGVLKAERLTDAGALSGLGGSDTVALGFWPAQGTHAQANQLFPDISAVSLAVQIGESFATARVTPEGGSYDTAIEVRFTAYPADALVYVRPASGGNWAVPTESFFLARSTDYQYFAQTPDGRRGPVHSVSYTFPPPDEMDSDGDGVPDYVEISKGINPLLGFDSDLDGFSDLDELLLGTLANNGDSRPVDDPENPLPRATNRAGFGLELTVTAHNRNQPDPEPVEISGTTLTARTLAGGLLASVPSNAFGEVFFANLPILPDWPMLSIATAANFRVQGDPAKSADPAQLSGRELLGLIVPPAIVLPTVPYSHGGGNDLAEANAWLAAAADHYDALGAHQEFGSISLDDTLAALIFEYGIAHLLVDRGLVDEPVISLFPHRPGDVDRFAPGDAGLRALRTSGPNGEAAIDPPFFYTSIRSSVAAGAGKLAFMKALARDIYQASTLHAGDLPPGEMLPPVDVLRTFLLDATIPPAYLPHLSMNAFDAIEGRTAAVALALSAPERPVVHGLSLLPPSGPTPGCTLLMDSFGEHVALVDARGRPFLLPMSFQLSDGMRFVVSGYTDASSPCASNSLEVTSFVLGEFVFLTPEHGSLLPGALAEMVGADGLSHLIDSDNDGYSDLQEYLDGTDPLDPLSIPAGAVVDLSLPAIELKTEGPVKVEWTWPAGYQQYFNFSLQSTDDLSQPFQTEAAVIETLGDEMKMDIPSDAGTVKFYRLAISLK